MSRDQYTLTDPTKLYADIETKAQSQKGPGLDADLEEHADHGEQTYRGTGRLTGRKALITGGDSGIGAAVAIAYAREGADVAISYLPEEEEDAQRIVGFIEAAGRQALALPGDLKDSAYCQALVETTVATFGGLDILVNNGGKQQFHEDLTEITDEQFDDTLKTNVYALFWITRAALPPTCSRDRPSSTPPRSRPTRPRRSWSITPPPRPPSTPSPRLCPSSWRPRASGSTWLRQGRSGPPCRPQAGNRRRSFRSSVSRPRWAAPVSPLNSLRRMCSWPRPNPAM